MTSVEEWDGEYYQEAKYKLGIESSKYKKAIYLVRGEECKWSYGKDSS